MFDEFPAKITHQGVEWLRRNDPGRYKDLRASRSLWVTVIGELGELYECATYLEAVFHIPKEYVRC